MINFKLLLGLGFILFTLVISSCKKEDKNQPPQIESIELLPNETTFAPGTTIQLTINAFDKEGDEIYYEWSIPNEGFYNPDDLYKRKLEWKAPINVGTSGKSVTFTAHVYSPDGNSGGDNAYKRVSFLIK